MRGKKILLLCLLGLLTFTVAEAAPTGLPSGFSATALVNSGLGTPTSVRVAPNGRIFIFDLYGSIKIFTPGSGLTTFGSVSVTSTGDRGLLGATFDRDFNNNPYLYIHYVDTDRKVRIGRFNASTNTGTNFTDLYIAPMVSEFQHAGGGIAMGNDNNIYFGIGDSGTPNNSQNLTNPHGKIHRIARDGSIPATNPNWNSGGALASIYASGFRNPFRLHTDRTTGEVYVGDVGYNSWEEINRLVSGKNYGWPIQEGPCTSCAYENPIYWYPHDVGQYNTSDASIVAGPIYRGSLYPASYQGKMFVSDYVRGFLRTINTTSTGTNHTTFSTNNGPVIDMDFGPDGKLYFITIFSPVLYRVDYNGGGGVNLPPVASSSASQVTGPSPLTVNFSSQGSSDPEGTPLIYNWNFGDGSTSNEANPTKTFNNEGQYAVSLSVSDGTSTTPASNLSISVGTPPTVTINSPSPTLKFSGNDVINFSASARQVNGQQIATSSLRTSVVLHHSSHTHPFLGPLNTGVGNFTIPNSGELSPDIWYRIHVEATGSNGVIGKTFVDIQPRLASLTVNTSPAGLNVVLDGSNHVIPPTVQGVAGINRSVSAPSPQLFSGQQYAFSHWSDGGSQTHEFAFPSTNTTLTANYVVATSTVPPTTASTTVNLLSNSTFENWPGSVPVDWSFVRWGTNDASLIKDNLAIDGLLSAKLNLTNIQSGESRFYHKAVNINPGENYRFRYQYKSNIQTKMVADVTRQDGTHQYLWFGFNDVSNNWREQIWNFTAPANAKNVVVSFYLSKIGYLQVDNVALENISTSVPPPPTPPITTTPTPTATTTNATSTSPTPPIATSTNNLILNPSAITVPANSTVPLYWYRSNWGSNTVSFSLPTGRNDDRSFGITMNNFSLGDAKWYFNPVDVVAGRTYAYSFWYKSSARSEALIEYYLNNGTKSYYWLGIMPNTTIWTEVTRNIVIPANVTRITVQNIIKGNGTLEVDDVNLKVQ